VFAQKEREVLEEWKRQYQVEIEAGMEECTRNPFNGQKTSSESTHQPEDLMEKCTKCTINAMEPHETMIVVSRNQQSHNAESSLSWNT
jgi:hypothetical protein